MPCYHPLQAWQPYIDGRPRGALLWRLNSSADSAFARPVLVPCGKCIGCRLDASRKWAVRCMHEAFMHDKNSFITLTYSDENLPANESLCKRDLQLFFKRLRKAFPQVRMRYFACGEYGEKTMRPHYHALLFGLDFDDKRTKAFKHDEALQLSCTSNKLREIWSLGHVACGDITFNSAAYVARYNMKKVYGADAKVYYGERVPEFLVMSRRPGIGADWYGKFKSDVDAHDAIMSRGHWTKVPRYYDELKKKLDYDDYERTMQSRYENRDDNCKSVESLSAMYGDLSRAEKVRIYKHTKLNSKRL